MKYKIISKHIQQRLFFHIHTLKIPDANKDSCRGEVIHQIECDRTPDIEMRFNLFKKCLTFSWKLVTVIKSLFKSTAEDCKRELVCLCDNLQWFSCNFGIAL